jgi:uncharacterized membrane protein YphA (DoxX/SURF4 family)
MKTAVTSSRIFVGVLFIISGLVKANDPMGLSYKMQEFFEVWTTDLAASHFFLKDTLIGLIHFLNPHTLGFSISMIVLEIMAGAALLVGWHKRFVLSLLLVLITFFTFLTAYAYASGKFKNCGCFGDCIPITPFTSLVKDVILFGLILFLFFARNYIKPVTSKQVQWATLGLFLFVSVGLQWYVLRYLPLADCLPFKKSASIATGMKLPPNAVPDSFAIRFVYERNGKNFEFSPESLPADLASYKFVARTDKLIRKGNAEPAIKGFVLSGSTDVDSTNMVLAQPNAVLYFYENDKGLPVAVRKNLVEVYKAASAKQVPVYLITTSLNSMQQALANENLPGLQIFKIDFTAFRTAARTNPCIYFLQNGNIREKESQYRTNEILDAIQKVP